MKIQGNAYLNKSFIHKSSYKKVVKTLCKSKNLNTNFNVDIFASETLRSKKIVLFDGTNFKDCLKASISCYSLKIPTNFHKFLFGSLRSNFLKFDKEVEKFDFSSCDEVAKAVSRLKSDREIIFTKNKKLCKDYSSHLKNFRRHFNELKQLLALPSIDLNEKRNANQVSKCASKLLDGLFTYNSLISKNNKMTGIFVTVGHNSVINFCISFSDCESNIDIAHLTSDAENIFKYSSKFKTMLNRYSLIFDLFPPKSIFKFIDKDFKFELDSISTNNEVYKCLKMYYFLENSDVDYIKSLKSRSNKIKSVSIFYNSLCFYLNSYLKIDSLYAYNFVKNSFDSPKQNFKVNLNNDEINFCSDYQTINYFISSNRILFSCIPDINLLRNKSTENQFDDSNHIFGYYADYMFGSILSTLILGSMYKVCHSRLSCYCDKVPSIRLKMHRYFYIKSLLSKENDLTNNYCFDTFLLKDSMKQIGQPILNTLKLNELDESLKKRSENFWQENNIFNGFIFPAIQAVLVFGTAIISIWSGSILVKITEKLSSESTEIDESITFAETISMTNLIVVLISIILVLLLVFSFLHSKIKKRHR